LRKRYHSADKSSIEESVSTSIEKNLSRINWGEAETISKEDYKQFLETARSHLRNLFKKLNKTQNIEKIEASYNQNNNSVMDDDYNKILEPSFVDELMIKDQIERLIQDMPKQYREIVSLYLQGYCYKDISAQTGLTEDNIKQRFCRLKKWAEKRERRKINDL
jgi:DNA-directed RNA polymerase specialized sigma24 family protein